MTKKTTKKTAARERISRYVGQDGEYLALDEQQYAVKIAWYFPGDGDFGLYLGNANNGGDETKAAVSVIRDYFRSHKLDLPSRGSDFEFDSVVKAREVLRLINAALHYRQQNKPIPEWATKALADGWLPPKGWRP